MIWAIKAMLDNCYLLSFLGASITLDIIDTSGSYEFPAMRRLSIETGRPQRQFVQLEHSHEVLENVSG